MLCLAIICWKNRGSSVKKNNFFCSRQKQIKQTGKYCCTVCKIIAHIGSRLPSAVQGCIFRLTCSHPELTEDHVLTSVYVKIFRTVTRNAVNKSVWRKKDCSWLPLNKHAMNIWLSSLRTCEHMILGQLRMGARQAKNAPLPRTNVTY